jgi:hypothetical protein
MFTVNSNHNRFLHTIREETEDDENFYDFSSFNVFFPVHLPAVTSDSNKEFYAQDIYKIISSPSIIQAQNQHCQEPKSSPPKNTPQQDKADMKLKFSCKHLPPANNHFYTIMDSGHQPSLLTSYWGCAGSKGY